MPIWDKRLTPDQTVQRLAHSVLVENTKRIQDIVTKDEKGGLLTMQEALDILQAWNQLVARMEP